MAKDERPNDEGMTKSEARIEMDRPPILLHHWSFCIRSSFVIRASSFSTPCPGKEDGLRHKPIIIKAFALRVINRAL
jgi:hypothetical protein